MVRNQLDLSLRLIKAPGGQKLLKIVKSHNFLDFKGQNKRFLNCLIRLRSIRPRGIRKSWLRDSRIYPLGSRTQRPIKGQNFKIIFRDFLIGIN